MRCWSCHKAEMKEVKDSRGYSYRKCPECGATDTDVPKPLGHGYVVERGGSDGGLKGKGLPLPERRRGKK